MASDEVCTYLWQQRTLTVINNRWIESTFSYFRFLCRGTYWLSRVRRALHCRVSSVHRRDGFENRNADDTVGIQSTLAPNVCFYAVLGHEKSSCAKPKMYLETTEQAKHINMQFRGSKPKEAKSTNHNCSERHRGKRRQRRKHMGKMGSKSVDFN